MLIPPCFIKIKKKKKKKIWIAVSLSYIMLNQHANVQNIDLKVQLFGRGSIPEDLKSVLITVWYNASGFCSSPPCPSSNLVYRSLELTLSYYNFVKCWIDPIRYWHSHSTQSRFQTWSEQNTNRTRFCVNLTIIHPDEPATWL